MVVHDENRMQVWQQEKEKQLRERKKPQLRLSVMAVQCIACSVVVLLVLLLVLLLRVAGGEAYGSLRQYFQRALIRNEWATAVALLWNDEPLQNSQATDKGTVKLNSFTDDETAQLVGSTKVLVAVPPLQNGTLTSTFGERIHPINGQKEFHSGVDIAAPNGTSLVAMYDGDVVEVGENDTLGRYVRICHGMGIEIVYGHCERITVQQGDVVKAGAEVALVGSTGMSTGSHVHLSVIVDGEVCDPATLLSLESYV